ncbi:MAG: fibronectin type III domain-containing protein [Solirubrobacteraceae bacterium]|nr:fibronectin type III domain-containing protein [Solirubrobacteraceae bacterium]
MLTPVSPGLGRTRRAAVALAMLAGAVAPATASAIPSLPAPATPSAHLSVSAGNGTWNDLIEGPATASPLKNVNGLGADASGALYVGSGGRIAKVMSDGAMRFIAGDGTGSAPTPGTAAGAPVGDVQALTTAPDGTVYFSDWVTSSIYKVTPAGILTRVAGTGDSLAPVPGPAASSPLYASTYGLAIDSAGTLYAASYQGRNVVQITADGTLSVVDLGGSFHPMSVAVANGTVFVASSDDGLYKVVGGAPVLVTSVPGLGNPHGGLASDASGNVYAAAQSGGYIAKFAPDGTETRLAGTGAAGDPVAGPAIDSPLQPNALAADGAGTVYAGSMEFFLSYAPPGGVSAQAASPARVVRVGTEVPSVPRELAVTAGTTSLDLTFLAPITPGTSAITGYEVSLDGGTTWSAVATTTGAGGKLTATVTGLTPGTTYTVSVRARNAAGPGPATAGTPATTATAPSTPAAKPVALSEKAVQQGLVASRSGTTAKVGLPLECPPGPQGCDASGTLTVNLPKETGPRAAALTPVQVAAFSGVKIAAGTTRLYEVRLSAKTVKRMRKRGIYKTKATLKVQNHLTGGPTISSSQDVWLTIPRALATCATKRAVTVHWVTRRADRLSGVTITANGKRIKSLAGSLRKTRLTFAAGQPRIVTVVIRARTTDGRRLVSLRRIRLCGAKKAGYKKTKTLVLKPTTAASR